LLRTVEYRPEEGRLIFEEALQAALRRLTGRSDGSLE
jgi:hypothetical protein